MNLWPLQHEEVSRENRERVACSSVRVQSKGRNQELNQGQLPCCFARRFWHQTIEGLASCCTAIDFAFLVCLTCAHTRITGWNMKRHFCWEYLCRLFASVRCRRPTGLARICFGGLSLMLPLTLPIAAQTMTEYARGTTAPSRDGQATGGGEPTRFIVMPQFSTFSGCAPGFGGTPQGSSEARSNLLEQKGSATSSTVQLEFVCGDGFLPR